MPLLREEAAKLSQEDMLRGVIEEFINKDDLFGILPFAPTTGRKLWRPVTGLIRTMK